MKDTELLTRQLAGDNTFGAGNYLFRLRDYLAGVDPVLLDSDRPLTLGRQRIEPPFRLSEISRVAERLAAWYVMQGIGPKDAVALYLEDGLGYYFHFLALTRIGAIPAPLNPRLRGDPVNRYMEQLRPRAIVVQQGDGRTSLSVKTPGSVVFDVGEVNLDVCDTVRPYEHWDDDPVMIGHTSGTTGTPKPVQFNHAGFFYGVRQQLKHDLGARALSALPHSHAAAQTMFMSCALRQVPVRVQSVQEPASIIASIKTYEPELVLAFPKNFVDMIRHGFDAQDVSSVARWLSTGDASHESHIRRLVCHGTQTGAGGKRQGSLYVDNLGSSEFAFGILRNIHSSDTDHYERCIGRPFQWIDVKVIDDKGDFAGPYVVGRLGARSPSVTAGYWNDSAATTRNRHRGYWLTGDLVFYDEAGKYYHVDRTQDRILCIDRYVYSTLTEELILARFPEIFDCTVVECHDDELDGLALTAELAKPGVDEAALRQAISAVLERRGLPPVLKFAVVEPGTNEGVTGKKLKRVIRGR